MPATIGNTAQHYPTVSQTTHTFNLTLGSGTERKVVVGLAAEMTATISGATFDGNAMTSDVTHTNATDSALKLAFFYFDVPNVTPSGAYAITYTISLAGTSCSGYAWELVGAATGGDEANNSAEGTAAAVAPSLTATSGAALLGLATNSSATQTWTVSGDATERAEGNETGFTTVGADAGNVSSGTRTVTFTASASGNQKSALIASYAQHSGGGSSNAPRSMFYHLQGMR